MVLAVLAALDVAIAAVCARRSWWATTVVGAVALGVGYDAGVVAVGATIGTGPTLRGLNMLRFAAHLLLTPALIPAVTALGRARGVEPLGRRMVVAATAVALVPALALARISLVPREQLGLLRYVEVDPAPPIGAIVAVLVALTVGVAQARRGSPGLVAGVAVALVLFAVPPSSPAGLLLGAVAETVLLSTIVATLVTAARPASLPGPEPP